MSRPRGAGSESVLKPTIFREYDIRGIADQELTSEGIEGLGRAIGTLIAREKGRRVNVARDCRLSSERLRNAIVAGLVAAGPVIASLGFSATTLIYAGLGLAITIAMGYRWRRALWLRTSAANSHL